MPYIDHPVATLKNDLREYKHTTIDNPAVHDKSGKWIVTGKAEFAADHFAGHKFFGCPVLSTIQHGTVKSIDYSEAEKVKGFIKFFAASEIPGEGAKNGEVCQWGQEVGYILADNWYTALRAANLVKVEYADVDNSMFDPDKVLADIEKDPNSHKVLTGGPAAVVRDSGGNLERGGGANEGFAKCDLVFEGEYPWTTSYAHNELEVHQATAWWVGDEVYVHTGTQQVHAAHGTAVTASGLPENKVHVYSRFNCGGFGGKTGGMGIAEAVVMSKAVNGYPVLYKNTKKTNTCTRQHNFSIRSKFKVGVDTKTGKIIALDMDYYSNAGRAAGCPDNAATFGLKTTYNIPYLNCNVTSIETSTPRRGYWRDVADPPGNVNTATMIDKVAYKLNLVDSKWNPYTVRMNNIFEREDIFNSPEVGTSTANQKPVANGSFHIKEMLEYVATWSNFEKKWHIPATKKVKDIYPSEFKEYADWYHGIAINGNLDSHGGVSGSGRGGIIKTLANGKFQVITGSARGTAGGTTVCCAVVGDVLGAKDEDVLLGDWASTDSGLDSGIQAGSGHTGGVSTAYYNAAMELRYKLWKKALNTAPIKGNATSQDELEAVDSVVYIKGKHDLGGVPYSKLTDKVTVSGGSGYNPGTAPSNDPYDALVGRRNGGAWKDKYSLDGKKKYISVGDTVNTYGSGAAVAEVAVDAETGITEVLNYFLMVDTGCTIFKQGAIREMGAGTELFLSQGFFFGDIYDEATGALISNVYTEAQFPTYMDFEFRNLHVTDFQSEDAGGPFGCHGIAEPLLTNFCCLYQAMFNAIGVWTNPEKGAVSADKVLKALKRGIGADYEALKRA